MTAAALNVKSCKTLISVLVERKRIKLLLFVGNSNYKAISDEELFNSYGIWAKFLFCNYYYYYYYYYY